MQRTQNAILFVNMADSWERTADNAAEAVAASTHELDTTRTELEPTFSIERRIFCYSISVSLIEYIASSTRSLQHICPDCK